MADFERKNMQYRFLGNTGLRVSALSLGGWVTYGGQVGEELALKCMEEAWKHGINFFDSAEVYADGKCEVAMGKAVKKLGWKREDFVMSTKLFWGSNRQSPNQIGLSRKHLLEGMDASLKRLQLDYVDVIMAHRPDQSTPMEEIVRGFTHIIQTGKALYWGTSEWSAFETEHAHHIATKYNLIAPIADQPQYNMLSRERFEKEYAPLYKTYNYGTTIWSPLASGLLSGKYNDGIPKDSRLAIQDDPFMKKFREELETETGKAKIEKIKKLAKIAEELGGTTAALALAWCLKNPNVSTVITGASKPEQVAMNVKALDLVPKLTDDIMKKIEEILDNKPASVETFGRDF